MSSAECIGSDSPLSDEILCHACGLTNYQGLQASPVWTSNAQALSFPSLHRHLPQCHLCSGTVWRTGPLLKLLPTRPVRLGSARRRGQRDISCAWRRRDNGGRAPVEHRLLWSDLQRHRHRGERWIQLRYDRRNQLLEHLLALDIDLLTRCRCLLGGPEPAVGRHLLLLRRD